ncbi:MAG: hypothetical protein ACTSP7_11320, partial [Candidatus Heimdallarchaeota archaeon]
FSNKKIVAHFHEWISGPGLLYLKKKNVEISTIFMTHATQLGRNIAMGEEDINEVVDEYLAMGETIPPQKAYQYQVEGTHQLEVVCARECDVLITVSEAIAKETECILGRKPDFVIPNGMNFEQITKREDLATIHQSSRKTINQFIETYFNPYYKIDFEKFLLVHISGRYEFHNKGVDVFIKALQEVNEQLFGFLLLFQERNNSLLKPLNYQKQPQNPTEKMVLLILQFLPLSLMKKIQFFVH